MYAQSYDQVVELCPPRGLGILNRQHREASISGIFHSGLATMGTIPERGLKRVVQP